MDETKNELAIIEAKPAPTTTLIRPLVSPKDLLAYQEEVSQLIANGLIRGKDYSTISEMEGKRPKDKEKPSLMKAGAERVCLSFGCYPQYQIVEQEVDHFKPVEWTKRKKLWKNGQPDGWEEMKGESIGLYRYDIKCEIIQRSSGLVIASGIGSASTMEAKYIDRPRECQNVVLKMAQKRAFVAATLNAFALSDRFTQDLEDMTSGGGEEEEKPRRQAKQEQKKEPLWTDGIWAELQASSHPSPKECWGVCARRIKLPAKPTQVQKEAFIAEVRKEIVSLNDKGDSTPPTPEEPPEDEPVDDQTLAASDKALQTLKETASTCGVNGSDDLLYFVRGVLGLSNLKCLHDLTNDQVLEAIGKIDAKTQGKGKQTRIEVRDYTQPAGKWAAQTDRDGYHHDPNTFERTNLPAKDPT